MNADGSFTGVAAGLDRPTSMQIMKRQVYQQLTRELGPSEKEAIRLMVAQPSTIKRPVVDHPGGLLVGFDPADWEAALA